MANRTQQNKVLEAAARDGTLDNVYWYLTIRQRGVEQAAVMCGSIPVQPAGPDVETSRQYAHLMLELARDATPGAFLDLDLTAGDLLAQHDHHVWSEVDTVCPGCGGVGWDSCVCSPTIWRVGG